MQMTSGDVRTVREVVKHVCRNDPWDAPDVLSKTLEDLWRYPHLTRDHPIRQAAFQVARLARMDVLASAPPEVPADPEILNSEDVSRLWQVSETYTPEAELIRSEEWRDLVGSVAANVGVRAAALVELMFRGGLSMSAAGRCIDLSRQLANYYWKQARGHLRTVVPEPPLAESRKTLSSGAWGTVRGKVYRTE